jgi:hypothetical protein
MALRVRQNSCWRDFADFGAKSVSVGADPCHLALTRCSIYPWTPRRLFSAEGLKAPRRSARPSRPIDRCQPCTVALSGQDWLLSSPQPARQTPPTAVWREVIPSAVPFTASARYAHRPVLRPSLRRGLAGPSVMSRRASSPSSDHLVAGVMLPLSNRFLTVKGFTVSDR